MARLAGLKPGRRSVRKAGGSGGVLGTLLGVTFLAIMNNGLDMVNVPSFYQYLIKGTILVLAVYADKLLRKGKD